MKEYVEVNAPIPEPLLHHPCEPVAAGNSLNSLAKGYVANTFCIGEYKAVVTGLEKYNKAMRGKRDGL